MAKRSHPQVVDSIANVNGPAFTSAITHSAVVSISPVKKGKKCLFFDGTIADDTSKIQLVGFDALQQKKFHERQVPVELQNFEIKKSRYGDGYDAMLRSRSVIKASGQQDINASSIISDHYLPPQPAEASEILLNKLNDCEIYDQVTVTAKVTTVHEAVQLTKKKKQDVDASGSAKLVLWEEDIDYHRAIL